MHDAQSLLPDPLRIPEMVPVFGRKGSLDVEAAAAELRRALLQNDSAFTPGSSIWITDNFDEITDAFVKQPDLSGNDFVTKLSGQLEQVSAEGVQLFAEIYYLFLLPLSRSSFLGDTKRRFIAEVLEFGDLDLVLPEQLAAALYGGFIRGGQGAIRRRYQRLSYLIGVLGAMVRMSTQDRSALLTDRENLHHRLRELYPSQSNAQQNMLLYVLDPEFFLPVGDGRHKKRIRAAYHELAPNSDADDDTALYWIYRELCQEAGHPIDFYDPAFRAVWDPEFEVDSDRIRQAWLIKGSSVDGYDVVGEWKIDGFASLSASKLPELATDSSKSEIKAIVKDAYSHSSVHEQITKIDEFHQFLSEIDIGDVVVTFSKGRVHFGEITSPPEFVQSQHNRTNLRRSVQWDQGNSVELSDVPKKLHAKLTVQADVVNLTSVMEEIETLRGEVREAQTKAVLPTVSAALATDLHVPQEWLQEILDLLGDRPQVILYGPPGTGKTYIAQRLAQHIADINTQLVQFHPAYSYEDFFEGYRPTQDGSFVLKPGPLRRLADEAAKNPHQNYVLVIDEINRGNIASIFGELYFLLEYRDEAVNLLYSEDTAEKFVLPPNIYLIGTMNTADRSIALLDSAIRRRFAFVPLIPDESPTSEVLGRWLEARDLPSESADLLRALNTKIADPEFRIGPSYFMRDAVYEDGGLERVWRTSIIPLLEEHHYGELSRSEIEARYGLQTIRAGLVQSAASESDDAADGNESDVSPHPATPIDS